MSIIQLDRNLINKIAAGEVVERPLSVVKELTENAIDAGAGSVTVEIREGGLTQVRVTDNGGGIAAADLPLAFARHATSKIAGFDDLMRVETLGFRGEALSSIAAVAQVEMITKTVTAATGVRVEVHGGQLLSTKEIGCADGTTVIVSNLFYNTPARRKFLKKPATEAGLIAHCLEKLALGNTGLNLRYINNGQIVFQTTGNGDLKTTMLNVYGREIATKTVGVDATVQTGETRLYGLIGKPEIARGNRRNGSFFINGRLVENKLITRAIEAAMRTMLPAGKFPVYALNLTMPPDALDVNVHPTKMDVRFADEEAVFAFIEDAVRDALEEHNLVPKVRLGDNRLRREEEPVEQIELPGTRGNFERNPGRLHFRRSGVYSEALNATHNIAGQSHNDAPGLTVETRRNPLELKPIELKSYERKTSAPPARAEDFPFSVREERYNEPAAGAEINRDAEAKRFFTHYQIHGLAFQTYWLVSQGESLFLIDRHAAHERVLYENFLRKAREESVHAQNLLTPVALRLTPREKQVLHDNREIFARFGFGISYNENEENSPASITAVPFLMKGPLSSAFFTDLLDKMDEAGFAKNSPYTHKTELVAMAACKAAVKAGDGINEEEARALIEQLLALENPFTCPHGRPTIIEITRREIERRFKR